MYSDKILKIYMQNAQNTSVGCGLKPHSKYLHICYVIPSRRHLFHQTQDSNAAPVFITLHLHVFNVTFTKQQTFKTHSTFIIKVEYFLASKHQENYSYYKYSTKEVAEKL